MRNSGVKHEHIGPFEVVPNNVIGAVGLRNRSGQWTISPKNGYKSFKYYDDGVLIASRQEGDGNIWMLIDYHGNRISERYNRIIPAGEGYYIVTRGRHRNIMRRDGSIVLDKWPNRVTTVCNGYFGIGNTIRKTRTSPTQYVSGIAHVSGIVVFPMIFDGMNLALSDCKTINVTIGGIPYYVHNGALYDPENKHYPKITQPGNIGQYIEKIVNWILPGLQFFYRDTDADINIEQWYRVGSIIRSGFFVDVSTRLQRPAHKYRFLIASAHAAFMCADGSGKHSKKAIKFSPHAEEWRQAVLHRNAWFKVMDVYRKNGVTQIFLLQIPESAALLFGNNSTIFNFINTMVGQNQTLVDMARQSLDDKMLQPIHPRSLDKELAAKMHRPIGIGDDGLLMDIAPDLSPRDCDDDMYSMVVHALAHDRDVMHDVQGFPWYGIVGSVCEGCMYAGGTNNMPFGCGRLFEKSFRRNYVRGKCEYYKRSLSEPSQFERMQLKHSDKIKA
jgi:hypothetical protein